MSVAILVPVCSRAHEWSTLDECFLMTRFLPSFEATKDPNQTYQLYIGVDDDDDFFLRNRSELEKVGKVVVVSGCQHAPAWVWNRLASVAYEDGHEYMFQIGDDIVIETPGWTSKFIEKLKFHKNRGVVGPKNPVNFALRVGGTQVIENAFVHRNHYGLFNTFFHPSIRNWHCDEWLTQIYTGICSYTFEDVVVYNGCIDKRYRIESRTIKDQIEEGRLTLRQDLRGCFSFCLYGPYTEKYYQGLVDNVHLIRLHYPKCVIRVFASPEASAFVRETCRDVVVHETPEDGSRNMAYRFIPAFVAEYDFVCVRDTDSRVHARDRWCIDAFLDSPYKAYATRDHMWHAYRMMGGLWGCKGSIPLPVDTLLAYILSSPDRYTMDTSILEHFVYPLVRDSFVVFSHMPSGVLNDPNEKVVVIEYPLINQEFCGNVVLYREGVPYHEFTQV
jgi:hypothetical protein